MTAATSPVTCRKCSALSSPDSSASHHQRFHAGKRQHWKCAVCRYQSGGFRDALTHCYLEGHWLRSKADGVYSGFLPCEVSNNDAASMASKVAQPCGSDAVDSQSIKAQSIYSDSNWLATNGSSPSRMSYPSGTSYHTQEVEDFPEVEDFTEVEVKMNAVQLPENVTNSEIILPLQAKPLDGKYALTCSKCSAKLSFSLQKFRTPRAVVHVKACLGIRTHACSACGLESSHKSAVLKHISLKCPGAKAVAVDRARSEAAIRGGLAECFPGQDFNWRGLSE